ncbi:MAG: lysylphosphatidylglycerol synthase transmembrane domain-containing protein [Planctomycetaceae bacterium]
MQDNFNSPVGKVRQDPSSWPTRTVVRIVVTASLLIGIGFGLNWQSLGNVLTRPDPVWTLAAVAGVGVAHLICCLISSICLRAGGAEITPSRIVVNHLRGLFANQLLPTALAGDVYRLTDLCRSSSNVNVRTAASMLVVQRACGVVVAVGLATVFGAREIVWASSTARVTVSVLTSFVVLGVVAAILYWRGEVLQVIGWLRSRARRATEVLAAALALSLAQQCVLIVSTWMMAQGLDLSVGLASIALVVPLSLIAVVLPVSVNGLGVREAVYAFVLSQVGVPTEAAVGLAVSMLMISVGYAALGGATLWRSPSPPSRRMETATESASHTLCRKV